VPAGRQGVMGRIGVLEDWSNGVLEYWNIGVKKNWKDEMSAM